VSVDQVALVTGTNRGIDQAIAGRPVRESHDLAG